MTSTPAPHRTTPHRHLWLAAPVVLLLAATTACTHSGASASTPTPRTSASTPAPDASTSAAVASPSAAAAGTPATGGTARTTPVSACAKASIQATVIAQTQRTSGDIRMAIVQLTNTSSSNCTLKGWASVRLTNAAGEAVTVPTTLVNEPGPGTTVELKPGTTASAGIKWTVCVKSSDNCPVGNGLQVILPTSGGTAPTRLDGFPDAERSELTMATLTIGTIQPSREGVVAW